MSRGRHLIYKRDKIFRVPKTKRQSDEKHWELTGKTSRHVTFSYPITEFRSMRLNNVNQFWLGLFGLFFFWFHLTRTSAEFWYSPSCRLYSILRTEVSRDLAPIRPDLGGNEVYASLWCQLAGGPINESDHHSIHACACKIHIERMP